MIHVIHCVTIYKCKLQNYSFSVKLCIWKKNCVSCSRLIYLTDTIHFLAYSLEMFTHRASNFVRTSSLKNILSSLKSFKMPNNLFEPLFFIIFAEPPPLLKWKKASSLNPKPQDKEHSPPPIISISATE